MTSRNAKGRTISRPTGTLRIAVVVSRFNAEITRRLLDGAVQCLRAHRIPEESWRVLVCPGSFELPQVAARIAAGGGYDAVVCLGAVIRGETPHFEYVSAETARGIQSVALQWNLPVVFGVLTTNTVRQARERAGGKLGNKGWDAVLTALEMVELFRALRRNRPSRQRHS